MCYVFLAFLQECGRLHWAPWLLGATTKQEGTGLDSKTPVKPSWGGGGGPWHWLNILGNASTCWSPFLVDSSLDRPVVLSTICVFRYCYQQIMFSAFFFNCKANLPFTSETFLLPLPRDTSVSYTMCSFRNIFSLLECAPSLAIPEAMSTRMLGF